MVAHYHRRALKCLTIRISGGKPCSGNALDCPVRHTTEKPVELHPFPLGSPAEKEIKVCTGLHQQHRRCECGKCPYRAEDLHHII